MWSAVCFEVDHGTGLREETGRRSCSVQRGLCSSVAAPIPGVYLDGIHSCLAKKRRIP